MASFFISSETLIWNDIHYMCALLIGLAYFSLCWPEVLTQINTDALTVLGFCSVICSARRPLAWPQAFSCHSGTERHLIPRHERIRSMLSTSVGKVLLFPLLSVVPICLLVLQKLNTAVVLLRYHRVLCVTGLTWN